MCAEPQKKEKEKDVLYIASGVRGRAHGRVRGRACTRVRVYASVHAGVCAGVYAGVRVLGCERMLVLGLSSLGLSWACLGLVLRLSWASLGPLLSLSWASSTLNI